MTDKVDWWNFGVWYVGGEKQLLVYQVAADDSIARMEVIELQQAELLHMPLRRVRIS